MRAALSSLITWMLVSPSLALACSVCFDASDENRQAFFDATVLLTMTPLFAIGAGGYWVYRQMNPAS